MAYYDIRQFLPDVERYHITKVFLERDRPLIPDQARRQRRCVEHFKELLDPAAHPNTAFPSRDISAVEHNQCEVDASF